MHAPEKRATARTLYVHDRLALTTIADRLDTAVSTVRRWKRDAENAGDDWEAARSLHAMSGGGQETVLLDLIRDYVVLHKSVIDQLHEADNIKPADKVTALSKLADAFAKTMASAERVSPKISKLAVATDVLQRLGEYVMETTPSAAPALLDVLEPFGVRLAKIYGTG